MIEIEIPFKIPTVNHLYFHWNNRTIMTKKAKNLREDIKSMINPFHFNKLKDKKLKVEVDIHEDWFTKKGEVKKKDVANREKFLTDSIFKNTQIDDKMIFQYTLRKIQSNQEKAIIKIEEYNA